MIVIIPQDMKQGIVYIIYGIVAVIIFLWGRAIGVNQTSEEYKLADKKSEVLLLRQKLQQFQGKNDELMAKNKMYLGVFSTIRHEVKKGE